MPVDSTHPDYDDHIGQWVRSRDAFQGSDAVKKRRFDYLPKLSQKQKNDDYDRMLKAAQWFGATERTIKGLAGSVMRKDPEVNVPTLMEEDLEDITLTGQSLEAFAGKSMQEQLKVGRMGILVDMPQQQRRDQRPYFTAYLAENIINWKTARINGQETLMMVVLQEEYNDAEDEFEHKLKTQLRVLRLFPVDVQTGPDLMTTALRYKQEVYRKVKVEGRDEEKWMLVDEIWPIRREEFLDYIPFVFIGAAECCPDADKPPLLDLIDTNYGLYRNSADYERALHFCGVPVWFFSGVPTGQEVVIGPSKAITAEEPNARGSIIQASSDSVGALREGMNEKKKELALLGASLLEEQKRAAEAAETLRLRQAGGQATLQIVADAGSEGITQALKFYARWIGADEEAVEFKYNNDFINITLTPDQIRAYMELHQNGKISYPTFYALLEGGELTRAGIEADEEMEAIESEEGDLINRGGGFRVVGGGEE